MRAIIGTGVLLLALLLSLPAHAFDCDKKDFGAKFSDLDDGNFVLYEQKDGVSYYNYTGKCRLQVHQKACPAISYAFVDGQYYARIIKVNGRNINAILDDMKKSLGTPVKQKTEGDWQVYTCELPGDIIFKIKHNSKTLEARSAMYSKPIREQLQKAIAADPTEVPVK